MQAVLISINPKWCELIASGKKTVELRKTKPKLDVPFKCYIYCTNTKGRAFFTKGENGNYAPARLGNGKIIGEFVCDKIKGGYYGDDVITENTMHKTCLSNTEIADYIADKDAYFWHISDLKIYDKPKKLREFVKYRADWGFRAGIGALTGLDCNEYITRPPQSWMYVEVSNE